MKQSEQRLSLEQYDPNSHSFTVEELRAIYRVLEHHYIPYDDLMARAVLTRITRIVESHELATNDNPAT